MHLIMIADLVSEIGLQRLNRSWNERYSHIVISVSPLLLIMTG